MGEKNNNLLQTILIAMVLPAIHLIIKAARSLADKYVDGSTMPVWAKKIVASADYLAKVWLKDIVEDTETTLDDTGLEELGEFCKNTALEGGFKLPEAPEIPDTLEPEPAG